MSSEIIDAPKILLVDDEPLNRRLLAAILAPEGYSILESESGEEALKILADQGADLVLLDVMMPGIGGVETCRRIREQGDLDLPIVFVTARGDRESRIEGKAVGADDFLTKPVDETELLVRVETLLKLKAYHDLKTRHRQSLEEAVQARTKDLSMALQELRETETNLRRSHREAIERLSRASEFRDDETGWHIQRMSRYCEMLARFSGQSEEFCAQLRLASPMHDVGKIGTPDAILLKPGRHTEAETVVMREHSAIGHRILDGSNMKLLDLAAAIAYTHHEKWDGSGYPDGLWQMSSTRSPATGSTDRLSPWTRRWRSCETGGAPTSTLSSLTLSSPTWTSSWPCAQNCWIPSSRQGADPRPVGLGTAEGRAQPGGAQKGFGLCSMPWSPDRQRNKWCGRPDGTPSGHIASAGADHPPDSDPCRRDTHRHSPRWSGRHCLLFSRQGVK